jgi:hypothetical protein
LPFRLLILFSNRSIIGSTLGNGKFSSSIFCASAETFISNKRPAPPPNVLHFETQVLIDGRDLPQPVNYMLLRILPPQGVTTDIQKRPFVIFDPRAGHGPGIGGMKKDSEIGIALQNGHPVYFVSFLPDPVRSKPSKMFARPKRTLSAKLLNGILTRTNLA